MAPERDKTVEVPRLQSPATPQETTDRGSFALLPAELYTNSSHQYFCFYLVWDSSQALKFAMVSKQGTNWVSHLTEFVVPPLARFMRDKFRARCFGVWNFWHDYFAGLCGGGPYPLMRNLFGVFSERR
ncbi:hypothetical protein V5799_007961 [Amblyomma americanum]|uniref:Uncharacterized protein n=1 Tax=Amblyomma americanum TaxID=6943 RepID=A0AAQ4FG08_AMBAM